MGEAPKTPSAAYRMLSIPDASELVLANTQPLQPIDVPFQSAFQHTLAADVYAKEPVPGFRASIKDGYAVVSSDGPGEYPIAFDSHAGSPPATLTPGSVAYVATGAPVPEGADAVVQIEDTQFLTTTTGNDSGDGGNTTTTDTNTTTTTGKTAAAPPQQQQQQRRVKILRQVEPGHDIRQIGSDMSTNELVLKTGHYIGAPEIGILATVGTTTVSVHKTPHIAVLSTGDEVCDPTTTTTTGLQPGQVRDANRAMLLAAAVGAGATTTDLGIARDTAANVESALDAAIAAGADILITTGGVSMGDKDFIKPLLERRGQVFFGKVCMKPGKPLTFATIPISTGDSSGNGNGDNNNNNKKLLVFGLPGNPVSSIVTFHLVVIPCLRKMMGWEDPLLRRVYCRLMSSIKMDPERPEYHRAIARWIPITINNNGSDGGSSGGSGKNNDGDDGNATTSTKNEKQQLQQQQQQHLLGGEFVAESTGGQISSRLLSLRSANVLLEIPRAKGSIPAGTVVSALVIGDIGAMPVVESVGPTVLGGGSIRM